MYTSFRLGRIAGIEIGANWSWLVVVALVLWSLAGSVFPGAVAGLSGAAYWGMAAVAALAFFASILLHELGHALVARREGVAIDGITLWLFGGVARLRGRLPSPRAEFRIAVAGPLVSAVIAGTLLLVAELAPLPRPVESVVFWIGSINVLLLAFNLLPALPLDGGRILHAALWARRGDLVRATRLGAAIGRAFGWLMIAAGIAAAVSGVATGGIWLALIGLFVSAAARAEAEQVIARERLAGLHVEDVMVEDPVSVGPDETIGEVIDRVVRRRPHSTYPVVDHGSPVGLLPFRSVAETPHREWDERTVRDRMLPRGEVPIVPDDEDAADALEELARHPVAHALVVHGGRLAGLLSLGDLTRTAELAASNRRTRLGRRRGGLPHRPAG